MRPERIVTLDELAYLVKKYFGWMKKSILLHIHSPVEMMLLMYLENLIQKKIGRIKAYRAIVREAIYRYALYNLFKF